MRHNSSPVLDAPHATRAVTLPTRRDVRSAWQRVRPHLGPSPLLPSPKLGPGALLKLETMHPTGSFKIRGAVSALSRLGAGERVVTASAGNHGLGVAHAAALLGHDATVVVPETASEAKLEALRRYPIRLVGHGASYDGAEQHAIALAEGDGLRYVSPYNDPDVIAGQGTVALDLLRTLRPPLTVLCPLGGGGLASGVGLFAAAFPGVRVIGVECEASASMRAALDAGRIVPIDVHPTLADGLGGNLEPGSVTFELCRRHLADVVVVREQELERAIHFLAREHGLVVEGAGAAAVAALLAGRGEVAGSPVALVTGRNIADRRLTRVLEGR